MTHYAAPSFWHHYRQLPAEVQRLADKNFRRWRATPITPRYTSRRFTPISGQRGQD